MRYDLRLLSEFCREIGFQQHLKGEKSLDVHLGQEAVLYFENVEGDEDCLVGFLNTPWHSHGAVMFADRYGHNVELDELTLLAGLREGEVLIGELERAGEIIDRWLIHSRYNDEFEYLASDERLCVRRASSLG